MRALAAALALAAVAAAAQETQESAPPAAPPRPAMMAPLAARTTLLSVAQAGSGVVAVGQRGHILTSTDGKDWQQVPAPVDVMLNRVRFRDAKAGWAVGYDATILATADGGASWTLRQSDPAGRALYDLIALDGGRLIAVGGYGSYYTSADDGATWQKQKSALTDLGLHFNAITRLNDGTLLLAGERGLLAHSKDTGATWHLLDSPYSGSFFGALPVGEHGAVVFGLRGHVYAAEDLGRCPVLKTESYDSYAREIVADAAKLAKLGWRALPTPTHESLFGGARSDAATVLVGVNGTVVVLDAAARTVTAPRPPDGQTLGDVTFLRGRWLAVGRRGATDLGDLK